MPWLDSDPTVPIPFCFKCPISLELMRDPVSLHTGVTYDRENIQKWLDNGKNTCPATMQVLQDQELLPNHTLRRLIQQWCVANGSKEFERIPRPISSARPQQLRLILEAIASGVDRLAALKRLRSLATVSDANRKCIKTEGAIPVLANLIAVASLNSDLEAQQMCEVAVGILILFPLDETTRRSLLYTKPLQTICLLVKRATLDARVNAALLLESLAADRFSMTEIGAADGAVEGLLGLLKEEDHPIAVGAGLKTLRAICSPLKNRIKIVKMGAIPILVEVLSRADKGITERVMALFDALSSCAEGRAAIREHPVAIPALLKCVPSSEHNANEHALGALWSICVHSAQEETIQAALEMGAFNKLLLLMHIDCTPRAKQMVKDLLKLFSEISDTSFCRTSEAFYDTSVSSMS